MAYRSLVDTQLRKAFVTVKDLALEAIFQKKNVSGFNFGTGSVNSTNAPPVVAKVVVTKTEKKKSVTTKTLMVQASDIGELNDYAKVILEGETYSFGAPIKNTGFILILTVFREG